MKPDDDKPSARDIRCHELKRIVFAAPIALPVITLAVALAAYLTGLTGWAWNLVAIPALILPAAVGGIAAQVILVPPISRRLSHVSPVPVMAGIRWIAVLTILSLLLLVLGPPLVRSGVWWSWFPVWAPRVAAGAGLVLATVVALYDRLYFRLLAAFTELEKRRELERFLPRAAVDKVLAGEDPAADGDRRVVTVLFADLRDSTAVCEAMTAPQVVGFLNSYVGAMAAAVFNQGGMIDKYLGDGLMAVFGVLPDPTDGAEGAVRAALEIRERMAALNDGRLSQGLAAVHYGVGIHTGEVVLGTVGIVESSDYTAVGDTVNTASRLEALTKDLSDHDVDAVLSDETFRRLRPGGFSVRSLGPTDIRGRTGTIAIHRLA